MFGALSAMVKPSTTPCVSSLNYRKSAKAGPRFPELKRRRLPSLAPKLLHLRQKLSRIGDFVPRQVQHVEIKILTSRQSNASRLKRHVARFSLPTLRLSPHPARAFVSATPSGLI